MISKVKFVGRILGLYMCVLIPMLSVSLLVAHSAFEQTQKREEKLMQRILTDVSDELESWQNEFQNQTSAVGTMLEMSPSSILNNPENARKAIELIQYANTFNGRTEDIILYYGVGRLYSSKGITNVLTYFNTTLGCDLESTDRGAEALASASRSTVLLKTKRQDDLLLYHFPIRKYSAEYGSSVQFIVSMNEVVKLLESYVPDGEMMFRIRFEKETVSFYLSEGTCRILSEEDAAVLMEGEQLVLTRDMPGTSLNVELHFDPRKSWRELWNYQMVNLWLLVFGLLFSVIISFSLSVNRWTSFQSVTKVLKGEKTTDSRKIFVNEYDYLKSMLEQSRLESDQMALDASQYRHAMTRQAANMIFHGLLTKAEVIQHLLDTCGLELTEEYFYLCGVCLKEGADETALEALFSGKLYCECYVKGKKAILFLEESQTLDESGYIRTQKAKAVRNEKKFSDLLCGSVAISLVYDSLSMVNYAYLEVLSLLENSELSNSEIACWDMYLNASERVTAQIQTKYLERFMGALEERNEERARNALENIWKDKTSESSENKLYIRYCIRQALILAARSDESEQGSSFMKKILALNPAEENGFFEKVKRILQSFCADSNDGRMEGALAYLEENFSRYDLSLEEVAEHVGMSKTQMSKYFKSQTGKGYLEFLTELRMNKACELLAKTDESVKNILEAVGYLDKTSFTRKFKACFGMSPTEYRGQARNCDKEMQ